MPRTDSNSNSNPGPQGPDATPGPGQEPAKDAAPAPTAPPPPAAPSPLAALIERHRKGEIDDARFAAAVADLNPPAPPPAATVLSPVPSATPQAVAPNVTVNLPPAPVQVDEFFQLPWEDKVYCENGDQFEVVPDPQRPGKTTVARFVVNRGVRTHVRGTKAYVAADGKTAQPVDGRPALPFGPGKPGYFGFTTLQP